MKNLKKKVRFRIQLKSKHLLAIMTIFCVSCIAATFASGVTTAPLQDAAGIVIVHLRTASIRSVLFLPECRIVCATKKKSSAKMRI